MITVNSHCGQSHHTTGYHTRKSMPTVEIKFPLKNFPSRNRTRRQVFPTPESPSSITCNPAEELGIQCSPIYQQHKFNFHAGCHSLELSINLYSFPFSSLVSKKRFRIGMICCCETPNFSPRRVLLLWIHIKGSFSGHCSTSLCFPFFSLTNVQSKNHCKL